MFLLRKVISFRTTMTQAGVGDVKDALLRLRVCRTVSEEEWCAMHPLTDEETNQLNEGAEGCHKNDLCGCPNGHSGDCNNYYLSPFTTVFASGPVESDMEHHARNLLPWGAACKCPPWKDPGSRQSELLLLGVSVLVRETGSGVVEVGPRVVVEESDCLTGAGARGWKSVEVTEKRRSISGREKLVSGSVVSRPRDIQFCVLPPTCSAASDTLISRHRRTRRSGGGAKWSALRA